ncbi:sugar ABC transporter permease [candidate division KSB3 bacterium]|uniref:Sugar ABC transporter permease n=1 Tax=candidate division KSB3 bacterium TaxID=2044937 RepID=A0A2G6KDE3_9BACT|nr:MAG: sugar ABC transporter permease [candidate division KSB3 bacterium]
MTLKTKRVPLPFTDPTINYLLLILIALAVGFELALPGNAFVNLSNFQSMAFQVPELGMLAIAMMITMLSGGINLSIIATTNMTAITTAFLLTHFIEEGAIVSGPAFVMLLAVAAGLLVAVLVGLINGLIIAYVGVSPILATLGTMTLIEGLNVALTRGDVISGFPAPILFIGNGVVSGIPMPMIIFVACAAVVAILLNRSPLGVSIYMIGSNEKATLFSGVPTRAVQVKIYMLSGLQLISSGLNLLGFSTHLTIALWGAILIVVISLRHFRSWFGKVTT